MSLTYIVNSETHHTLLEQLAHYGVPETNRQIYKGRNSLYAIPDSEGNGELNIKDFHRPNFPNNYIYTTIRHSKARRSFDNATRLLADGILTPQPIGWAEVREGMKLTRSYYVSRQLEDVETVRDWERFPFCDDLLEAIAQLMLKLVKKGIWHKDFSPGNILFHRNDNGTFNLYLVDVNRMEFDVTSRSKLMGMFRCINTDRDQTIRLARHYARVSGENEEKIVAEALEQLESYLAEKARHRFYKRFTRRNKKK